MTNKEKIQLLKTLPPSQCCLRDYYQELFSKVAQIKFDYGDFMITEPLNCDEELKRTANADWNLCCALFTMLLREDSITQQDNFEKRFKNGDIQNVINRLIFLLEEK